MRRRIGVTGQYAGLDEFLTDVENLELVGRLGGLRSAARGRAGDLIERLRAARHRRPPGRRAVRRDHAAGSTSPPASWAHRRCCSSTSRPPASTRPPASALWDVVGELTADGTTVVLTTQYLEEADRLADDIVVLDHGRIAPAARPAS